MLRARYRARAALQVPEISNIQSTNDFIISYTIKKWISETPIEHWAF